MKGAGRYNDFAILDDGTILLADNSFIYLFSGG